ncbi:MAG TPA: putative Ig domain-containing protein [Candidatus Tectomicrobia bacterium]|nr:putative Ig domain-containing protein [Candidatus Tectomicrobia bacterium]
MRWQPLQVSYQSAAGEPFVFSLPSLERIPTGKSVQVALEPSGDNPSWLQLDHERLQIRGTAPHVTEDQTHQLIVRARAESGSDSRLLVLLTITAHPQKITPSPQLRGHWTW